jgi:hypothetical protein
MEVGVRSIFLVVLLDVGISSVVALESHLELFHALVVLAVVANELNELVEILFGESTSDEGTYSC